MDTADWLWHSNLWTLMIMREHFSSVCLRLGTHIIPLWCFTGKSRKSDCQKLRIKYSGWRKVDIEGINVHLILLLNNSIVKKKISLLYGIINEWQCIWLLVLYNLRLYQIFKFQTLQRSTEYKSTAKAHHRNYFTVAMAGLEFSTMRKWKVSLTHGTWMRRDIHNREVLHLTQVNL